MFQYTKILLSHKRDFSPNENIKEKKLSKFLVIENLVSEHIWS